MHFHVILQLAGFEGRTKWTEKFKRALTLLLLKLSKTMVLQLPPTKHLLADLKLQSQLIARTTGINLKQLKNLRRPRFTLTRGPVSENIKIR